MTIMTQIRRFQATIVETPQFSTMWFYRALIATLLLSTASVDALEQHELGSSADDLRPLTQEEIDHWVRTKNDDNYSNGDEKEDL